MPTDSNPSNPNASHSGPFQADSLAVGMLVMLLITIVQRGIGFCRGIYFCRLMPDEVLGQWVMAFGFIMQVTPVFLMGIPGSLPRYVEHFQVRGHLRRFLRRIVLLTGALVSSSLALMLLFPNHFGWFIFRDPSDQRLVASVGLAVLAIVVFNTLNELVSALRQVRIVSIMQFIQSVGFTLVGLTWLSTGGGLAGLVVAFSATTLIGTLPGWWILLRRWDQVPISNEPFDAPTMWKRLLPYAAAIWVMNLLSNTFELSDRYMMLHFSSEIPEAGQRMVGQYHSGCLIPCLLLSVGLMIAGILMPYLTADWEAGKRKQVAESLRRALFGISTAFTAGAAIALWIAPWLFQTLLDGRYSEGLSVMPLAFTFCIWASLGYIAQNYLWVAEKGKLVGIAFAVGLVTNIGCNYVLMPRFGLVGAVVATLLANGVVLLGTWCAARYCGFPLDRSTIWATLLPATLLAGPLVAILSVITVILVSDQAQKWIGDMFQFLRSKWDPSAATI